MAAAKKGGHRNVAVIVGVVAREPEVRELPGGAMVVELDVKVVEESGTSTVPVSWPDGQVGAGLVVGADVVVVGRVRRRFWNAGGGPMSRTDVLAEVVVPAAPAKRAGTALAAAAARITG
jgi:single-strand DNA-binding protein